MPVGASALDVLMLCRNLDIPSFVSESRSAQGLPPRVEDPATLAKVATLLAAVNQTQIPEASPQPAAGLAAAS